MNTSVRIVSVDIFREPVYIVFANWVILYDIRVRNLIEGNVIERVVDVFHLTVVVGSCRRECHICFTTIVDGNLNVRRTSNSWNDCVDDGNFRRANMRN